jgi:hypothetical protein
MRVEKNSAQDDSLNIMAFSEEITTNKKTRLEIHARLAIP